MSLKSVVTILSILGLIISIGWAVYNPGWEPVLAIVGFITSLITNLYGGGDNGNKFNMTQKGGRGSANYQSKGNITITNNNDKR